MEVFHIYVNTVVLPQEYQINQRSKTVTTFLHFIVFDMSQNQNSLSRASYYMAIEVILKLNKCTSDARCPKPGSAKFITVSLYMAEMEKTTRVQSTDEGKKLTCR